MPEPQTREELEQTIAFKAGVEAKKNKTPLAYAIRPLRPGCWRYYAFIEGYDSIAKKRKRK